MWNESMSMPVQRETRPFAPFVADRAFHFYVLQFVTFGYAIYRFASRNYTVYGHFPEEMFDRPFTFLSELWPVPLYYFTSFQFLYEFLPRPGVQGMFVLQGIVIGCGVLGIAGIRPKWSALVAFLVATHITGMMQASNAPVDGGTVFLCALLVLAVSPTESFYGWRNGFQPARRATCYRWPVFLFMLFTGSFYTLSGLSKIVDVGFHWPFVLHLELFAARQLENSLFLTSRYVEPWLCVWHLSYAMSVVGGIVTMIAEIGFLSVLWWPRYRMTFIPSIIALHVLVYLMAGINFVGSSLLLLVCFDWNATQRRLDIQFDPQACGSRTLRRIGRLDWFHRIEWQPMPISNRDERPGMDRPRLIARDEHGALDADCDALERICERCPPLWPVAVAFKIPGVIHVGRKLFRHSAKKSKAVATDEPRSRRAA